MLYTTNLAWIYLGFNPDLRCDMAATNRLQRDKEIKKRTTFIWRSISYRAVNTFRLGYQESMLVYVIFLMDGEALGQVFL